MAWFTDGMINQGCHENQAFEIVIQRRISSSRAFIRALRWADNSPLDSTSSLIEFIIPLATDKNPSEGSFNKAPPVGVRGKVNDLKDFPRESSFGRYISYTRQRVV